MTQEELLALISTYDKAVEKIKKTVDLSEIETYLKQYDPAEHDIFDKAKRPDKLIKNNEGNTEVVPVTRIGIALQKLITSRAASFLCGNPIEIKGTPNGSPETNMLAGVNKVWLSNKLDFKSKELARLMFSETHCAELWYAEETTPDYWIGEPVKSKWKLRVKILAASLGDNLYPVFNPEGDMIAFGRGYIIKVDDKDEEHFDLYTNENIYLGTKSDAGWDVTTEKNVFTKIPIVYYSQPKPIWNDVQTMITQLETVISNNSNTNAYFGDPLLIIDGEIEGFAKKGQTGKT
ncbi:MAG TPA: phage portal protein, partial [Chitinophagaceae bacterium]